MGEPLKKYFADRLYETEEAMTKNQPFLVLSRKEVYVHDDVEAMLNECHQVLAYLVERHHASKLRSVTIDWSRATRLLARLEGK